jgi:peptide/nickel transport system ATP-binding protein
MRSARRELRGVPGKPPDLRDSFAGCPFAPRCEYQFEPCGTAHPVLRAPATRLVVDDPALMHGWRVACHLHDQRYRPAGPPDELAGAARDRSDRDVSAADSPVSADSPVTADRPVGADSPVTTGGDQ